MMQFTFETQGTNTFLVYEMGKDQIIDSVSMGMISNNKIEGIIPFQFSQLDKERYFKYNVSSKVSLSQYFSGIVNKKRMIRVMESISRAVINAQDYMMEVDNFAWDKEYIFVDASKSTAHLICIPVLEEQREKVDIEKFFKDLLLSVQFDQTENCDYVAKLLGFFNANAHFSLQDFLKTLVSLDMDTPVSTPQVSTNVLDEKENREEIETISQNTQSVATNSMGAAGNITNLNIPQVDRTAGVAMAIVNNPENKHAFGSPKKDGFLDLFKKKETNDSVDKQKNNPVQKNNIQIPGAISGNANGGKQIAMPGRTKAKIPGSIGVGSDMHITSQEKANSDIPKNSNLPQGIGGGYSTPTYKTEGTSFGGTVVLNEDNMNGKTIPYIVRQKNGNKIPLNKSVFKIGKDINSDYPIGDNKAVSSRHAELIIKGMQVYIVDMGSTNHTFVDGQMIASNKEIPLKDGTEFVLANEVFKLYLS